MQTYRYPSSGVRCGSVFSDTHILNTPRVPFSSPPELLAHHQHRFLRRRLWDLPLRTQVQSYLTVVRFGFL